MNQEVNQKDIENGKKKEKEELQIKIWVFLFSSFFFPTLLFFISSLLYAIGIIDWDTLSKILGPGPNGAQVVTPFPLAYSLLSLFFLFGEVLVMKLAWEKYRGIVILGLTLGGATVWPQFYNAFLQ